MDFPASLGYRNEKLITNEKKKYDPSVVRTRNLLCCRRMFLPLCHRCKFFKKLNKQYIREIRDSMKRTELRP